MKLYASYRKKQVGTYDALINLLLESRSYNKIAGPATVVASLASVPLVVAIAYTCPAKSCGIVTLPPFTGTNTLSSPVKNTTNVGAVLPFEVTVADCPGATLVSVSAEKAFTGSAGLVDGQEVMNCAARVNIWLRPRGTLVREVSSCSERNRIREDSDVRRMRRSIQRTC